MFVLSGCYGCWSAIAVFARAWINIFKNPSNENLTLKDLEFEIVENREHKGLKDWRSERQVLTKSAII